MSPRPEIGRSGILAKELSRIFTSFPFYRRIVLRLATGAILKPIRPHGLDITPIIAKGAQVSSHIEYLHSVQVPHLRNAQNFAD
jgi:hypothetical protein